MVPDAQQLGQDLLKAEVDPLAGLGGGRVGEQAVVLGEPVEMWVTIRVAISFA